MSGLWKNASNASGPGCKNIVCRVLRKRRQWPKRPERRRRNKWRTVICCNLLKANLSEFTLVVPMLRPLPTPRNPRLGFSTVYKCLLLYFHCFFLTLVNSQRSIKTTDDILICWNKVRAAPKYTNIEGNIMNSFPQCVTERERQIYFEKQ